MAVINATITLMVEERDGTNLTLTEVERTGNGRSVNVTVVNPGKHSVTCVADNNGLNETSTERFYGISKFMIQYSVHVLTIKGRGCYFELLCYLCSFSWFFNYYVTRTIRKPRRARACNLRRCSPALCGPTVYGDVLPHFAEANCAPRHVVAPGSFLLK